MKWLRKNDTRLMLLAMLLFTALLVVVSCQDSGEVVGVPTEVSPETSNTCLDCHSDQARVMALAVEPEALEAESTGEG